MRRVNEFTDNPYQIIGVNSDASFQEIGDAYKKKAKQFHPDVYSGGSANLRMQKLNWAFEVLKDPVSRKAIDLKFGQQNSNKNNRQYTKAKQSNNEPSGKGARAEAGSHQDAKTAPKSGVKDANRSGNALSTVRLVFGYAIIFFIGCTFLLGLNQLPRIFFPLPTLTPAVSTSKAIVVPATLAPTVMATPVPSEDIGVKLPDTCVSQKEAFLYKGETICVVGVLDEVSQAYDPICECIIYEGYFLTGSILNLRLVRVGREILGVGECIMVEGEVHKSETENQLGQPAVMLDINPYDPELSGFQIHQGFPIWCAD